MSDACLHVIRALGPYMDDELPGSERMVVSDHLKDCDHCAGELESLSGLGNALRAGAKGAERDHLLDGLAGGVTSRVRAEQSQSWRAMWSRVFEDWHWVGVGVGSVAGALTTFLMASAMLVTSINQLDQMNARAGTLYLIALPQSGRGAVMMEFEDGLGTAKGDPRPAIPASLGWQAERALVSALDEKLVHSGRPVSLLGLSKVDRDDILALLSEIAEFRTVQPARRPGGLTYVSGMHLQITTSVSAASN